MFSFIRKIFTATKVGCCVLVFLGLQVSAAKFFIFFLDLFLATMCASAIAFVVSASVGIFAIANLIVVLILILMMVGLH